MDNGVIFEDFSFRYKASDAFALEEVSIKIDSGDFIGVIGRSGSGKSALINAINGVIPHYYTGDVYGAVKVCGLDTVETRPEKLALRVGSVLQDIDSQTTATVVEEELLFGLENYSIPKDEIEERIAEALELIGISKLRGRTIRSLSGGQKQKVVIAAILALRPDILVLDEPTCELDPDSSRRLFELLARLNRENGTTIVIAEQKTMLLCEFCNRLVVMDSGRAVLCGAVGEVLARGEQLGALGVHVPRIVSLRDELLERGLRVDSPPRSIPEAVMMIEGASV